MTELALTQEQADILRTAGDSVVLRDPDGNVLGVVSNAMVIETSEDEQAFIQQSKAIAANRSSRWSTTEEVLNRLARLERPE